MNPDSQPADGPSFFTDGDSGDSGFVLVRKLPGGIGLTISFEHDGDLAAYMNEDTARLVAERIAEGLGAPA